jgi:hypothetical protein
MVDTLSLVSGKYVQGPANASVEETAALTLFTAAGQLYKQGTTMSRPTEGLISLGRVDSVAATVLVRKSDAGCCPKTGSRRKTPQRKN